MVSSGYYRSFQTKNESCLFSLSSLCNTSEWSTMRKALGASCGLELDAQWRLQFHFSRHKPKHGKQKRKKQSKSHTAKREVAPRLACCKKNKNISSSFVWRRLRCSGSTRLKTDSSDVSRLLAGRRRSDTALLFAWMQRRHLNSTLWKFTFSKSLECTSIQHSG